MHPLRGSREVSGISPWNRGWKREISVNPIRDVEFPGEQRDFQSRNVNPEEREQHSATLELSREWGWRGQERPSWMGLDQGDPEG